MSLQLLPVAVIWGGNMCRECGALVGDTTFEDNAGLCGRCAFPARRVVRLEARIVEPTMFINGVEVVGEAQIRRALAGRVRLLPVDRGN